jgi:hypothetical protein
MPKLFSRRVMDGAVITLHPKRVVLWRRVTLLHAAKGGKAVLRGESSWRTVSGVAIALRRSTLMIQWRGLRHG